MFLDPFCIVSDGISLYTAFFGHKYNEVGFLPDLVIARSNPYPSLGSNVTWTVVASLKEFKREPHPDQNYLCAWDPDYSSVVIFARSRVYQNDDVGYNLRMPVDGQRSMIVDWIDATQYSKQVYDQEIGRRSVLLNAGSAYPWIQIRSDQKANRLEFTYFGSEMHPVDEAESRWDMDVTKTGSNLILTHSNNTLFALGLKDANTRTYTLSEIPLDTMKTPLTQPSTIKTTDTTIERGCDLTNSQTSMHTDNGTVYILCKLFPEWIPVPKKSSASTWAYFLGQKRQAKLLKYPDVNSTFAIAGGTFEAGYRTLREMGYPRDKMGNADHGGDSGDSNHGQLLSIFSIIFGIIFAIVVVGLLARYFRRRNPKPTGDIPLTITASPGVHREVNGEDASDALPTHRVPDTNTID
ncbi:MAG: hypothetical protein J3Q66DRAFT_420601 [Benniella sp.]|nr:MAG: hypothetical protein J3Q66DRAFT_420601 [Benniella sp.]